MRLLKRAGSTWFHDYFYEEIRDNCIGYINIDSTGMLGARNTLQMPPENYMIMHSVQLQISLTKILT